MPVTTPEVATTASAEAPVPLPLVILTAAEV